MGSHSFIHKKTLVVVAVAAEQEAVLRGLKGDSRFTVAVAGVGPAAAAACTAAHLATGHYSLAVSAGIGGGFASVAEPGSLVLADEIIAADLGVETDEGFSSVDELGFGTSRIIVDCSLLTLIQKLELGGAIGVPVTMGAILTVSTATGSAATAAGRLARYPGAVAEAMEGFGVAIAAANHHIPCLEVRGISNLVGPRNRAEWRIPAALSAIEQAFHYLPEVLV